MVLRALVRLLEGGVNLQARFSEKLPECNVVFVPALWKQNSAVSGVIVRMVDVLTSLSDTDKGGDLQVLSPLRMSSLIAVLQCATQSLNKPKTFEPEKGMLDFFNLLAQGLARREQRRAVLPISGGQQVIVDFTNQLAHTAMPMESLLSGTYTLGETHRVSLVEEELIRSVPSLHLRQLIWGLAQRLAESNAETPERNGRYRLLRWPDALGLTQRGHPRLAAIMTKRSMTLRQIITTSEVPEASVRWFLEAATALNYVIDDDKLTPTATVPTVQRSLPSIPVASAPKGWFGQLRERLKLW